MDVPELVEQLAGARIALLGEASHGTHEFYALRARITRELVERHGFAGVAVEADWPDAYRVNCYVRGLAADGAPDPDANAALGGFRRFPSWMWRNRDVLELVEWLRERNEAAPREAAGFYGLDLYSLGSSVDAVVEYLERTDPEAAARARRRYSCFEHFSADGQEYGHATWSGAAEPCEAEVVAQLVELRRRAAEAPAAHGDRDRLFAAEQNARLVRNAERYYRCMFRGRASSWNLRDTHMADTLDALLEHLDEERPGAKVVVWAHNSHVGDARATGMAAWGELNLGQLARERHGDRVRVLGFTTYEGTVTAARDWGGRPERRRVRPALSGSWEDLLHERGGDRIGSAAELEGSRLQRAIGVVYRPETERASHYFDSRIADQFDVLVHLDRTTALEPLEREALWDDGEPPETFPSGL